MKVRWHILRYPEPKADEIKEFREFHGIGIREAKEMMTEDDKITLQYWSSDVEDWVDVPEQIEYV